MDEPKSKASTRRREPDSVPATTSDPLRPVLDLGHRRARRGLLAGLLGAVLIHGVTAAPGLTTLIPLRRFAEAVQQQVRARLAAELAIEVQEPEPPEPEPPEPEPPEPEQPPEPPEPEPEPPEPEPEPLEPEEPPTEPPAAAEASEVLTAEPDPEEPLDLTGEGFVTGTGSRYVGGVTSSRGTAKKAVRDRRARGNGSARAKPGPSRTPRRDLSRPAMPASRVWNDCGFPSEADLEQINHAQVTVAVTVAPNGRAKSVSVLKDPGYGFGRLAKRCALRKRYNAARNSSGKPITATTRPFPITFTR